VHDLGVQAAACTIRRLKESLTQPERHPKQKSEAFRGQAAPRIRLLHFSCNINRPGG
jgi:hypothetical protein